MKLRGNSLRSTSKATWGMLGMTSIAMMLLIIRSTTLLPQSRRMDHIVTARAEEAVSPHVDPSNIDMWHGLQIVKDQDWDFYGLKIPPTPAIDRVIPGQVKSDYDIKSIDPAKMPPGYDCPEPAFTYPQRNDRLFTTVSLEPRVMFFPQLATKEEVDEIINRAKPHLQRSQVALSKESQKSGKSSTIQDVRTSKSTWVNLDGKLSNLEKRVTTVLHNAWHEPVNVLLYGPKQHYDAHHDYFDPKMYGTQENNRMATIFFYLNTTEEGGETSLPRANRGPVPANFQAASCQQGLQVRPLVAGSAVLFYGMRPDLSLDPYSLHEGCDVIKGTKWGGALWFRAKTPEGTGQSHY
eukprot:TRINITY_DN2459_c2_g1_i1.p1 TRINITY_DN2459_c2_g1~~TRINITY_DN2459_c2_g1_i1.p1  ORF type:complete len:369 (+),score=44.70 TRINITY_DN2459_c2_g1_i1:56-1108(+)